MPTLPERTSPSPLASAQARSFAASRASIRPWSRPVGRSASPPIEIVPVLGRAMARRCGGGGGGGGGAGQEGGSHLAEAAGDPETGDEPDGGGGGRAMRAARQVVAQDRPGGDEAYAGDDPRDRGRRRREVACFG